MNKLLVIMILATACFAHNVKYTSVVKNGTDGVDGLLSPVSVAVSSDNKNVYVGCTTGSALVVFNRDSATGSLSYNTCIKNCVSGVDGTSGALFVAVSPDNKSVYVTGADDNAVAVYDRNSSTGELTYTTCIRNGVGGVNGLSGANSVIVSPDNKNVYVTGGSNDAIVVFTRNTTTGELTYSTYFKNGINGVIGLYGVTSVAISSNGRSLYTAGNNGIVVFDRDTVTGALSKKSNFLPSGEGVLFSSILVSSDNKNVYALSGIRHALSEFTRDTVTGSISLISTYNGITFKGSNVLQGTTSLCISPDDRNVFVSAGSDSAIILFNRDTMGSLNYDTCLQKGHDGIDGMLWASSVTVSPDNKNLYVLGPGDSSIAIFAIIDTTKSSAKNYSKNHYSSKKTVIRLLDNKKTIMVRTPSKAKWTICTIDGKIVRSGIFQHSGEFTIAGIQCGFGLFTIETAGGQRDVLRFTAQ